MKYSEENDQLGSISVPKDAYYGPQTQRAVDNFPISGLGFPPVFIQSLALIKKCAALVNGELGVLKPKIAEAVTLAAQEVIDGKFDDQFVVDIFQTGSGTSTNMNMNEVIAARANEILTGKKNGRRPVHPNDHVNAGQSSNDVMPSALHIAALTIIIEDLIPSMQHLLKSLAKKAGEFGGVRKIGRTHLQDAVPMTLGQEFSGYARQVEQGINRISSLKSGFQELALGGTAVGTGLNAAPGYAKKVVLSLIDYTNIPFRVAKNHFEAQSARDMAVQAGGVMKTVAVSLAKIAEDIRWLASGPRCGIGEINIPALQAGSSIMPGKINPVISEVVLQVTAQVIGNDAAITIGGRGGNFQLNTMLPVISFNLLQSMSLLSSTARVFADKCISGITANIDTCVNNVEQSLATAANLVPKIGYDRAADIARLALDSGQTIKETCLMESVLTREEADELFP